MGAVRSEPSCSTLTPALIALCSAFLFGAATPFSKYLLDDFTPFQLAGLLYLGAALASLPSAVLSPSNLLPSLNDHKNRHSLLGAVFFGGLLGPVLLLIGLDIAESTAVSLWLNLELVSTAIIGALIFKEHLGKLSWLGVMIASLASFIVTLEPGVTVHWAGIILFLACICWGIDNHLTARIDSLSPSQSTFWKGLVAGGVNLVIGLLLHPLGSDFKLIVAALLIGAVSYGVSIVLYIRASHSLGATRAQVVFSTAPFFGVSLSVYFLGEAFTWGYGIAAALFVVAIALQLIGEHAHPHTSDIHHRYEH